MHGFEDQQSEAHEKSMRFEMILTDCINAQTDLSSFFF